MLYVAADYWQIDYTEGELIVLASLPSAVSTGTGLTYSALSMSGNGASLATGMPLLTASMPILGTGTAQSLLNTSVSISTAIAGNPVATASAAAIAYSKLSMSANGYAISNSVSTVTMPMPINGQAYASFRITTEYADTEYWLEGYAETFSGCAIKVSTAIATSAVASAIGQTSMFSQMAMSANGYGNASGLANVKMALSCSANAFSQSTSYGQVFSTVAVMAMPHASAIAKCRMIKFVGYEFPIGTFTLNSVTPNHSLYNLTDIYTISSLTPLYDMNSVTPQYSIVSIS